MAIKEGREAMIKVRRVVGDKLVLVGNFKSYVALADWLDENPQENIGTYYIRPSHWVSVASYDRVVYDGAACISDRRGNI